MVEIENQKVEDWAAGYDGEKFHALLCDPPYHLTSITKRFGGKNSSPAKFGKDGAFSRASAGFMGKVWDGGDVAFSSETWEAIGNHLYPGAFGMAFASARGWHRLAVAIEDAGFIIHPSIFGWVYGSGWPKATRIDKKLDETWAGHRYGLQALKPAIEPIIVFQKPYEGRPLDNISEYGSGALNIDAGRLPTNEELKAGGNIKPMAGDSRVGAALGVFNGKPRSYNPDGGRWPPNFYVDTQTAKILDRQSGIRPAGGKVTGSEPSYPGQNGIYYPYNRVENQPFNDSGGASRFFFVVEEQLDSADPVFYNAKADQKERNAGVGKNNHPTVKPLELTRWLANLLLPPAEYAPRRILIPFAGTGSEAIGAYQAGWDSILGIEMDKEYSEIARSRIDHYKKAGVQISLDSKFA